MVRIERFDRLLDEYAAGVFAGLDGGFSRDGAGGYVCGVDSFTSGAFRRGLELYVAHEAGSQKTGDYCFIVGDCDPGRNILLDLGHVPVPAEGRYFLSERDVRIDEAAFNAKADEAFCRLFKGEVPLGRGTFAIRHARLGADTLTRVLKAVFGAVNCEESGRRGPGCVSSVNEAICEATSGKDRLNRMPEMKRIFREVRLYAGECVGAGWEAA